MFSSIKPGNELSIGSKVLVGIKGNILFSGIIIHKRIVYDVAYDDGDVGIGISREILSRIDSLGSDEDINGVKLVGM